MAICRMKPADGSAVRRDRFTVLEGYSRRYTTLSTRPLLSASDAPSRRDTPMHSRHITRPGSQASSPMDSGQNLALRPCEVLPEDFQRDEQCAETNSLFLKAFRLRARGLFEKAAQEYTALLQTVPSNVQARINLGVCHMKVNQVQLAREVYEEGVKHGWTDSRLLYNYAILHVLAEDYDTALGLLDTAQQSASAESLFEIRKLREMLEACDPPKRLQRQLSETRCSAQTRELAKSQEVAQSVGSPKSRGNQDSSSFGKTAPRILMWKVFRSVDEYVSRPATTVGYMREHCRGKFSPKTPKASFITAPKLQTSHKRRRSDGSEPLQGRASSGPSEDAKALAPFKNPPLVRVRMHGALLEEDLEDEGMLRTAQVDLALDYTIRAKAVEVGAIIRKETDKLYRLDALLPETDLSHVCPQKLTSEALQAVQIELRKDTARRNYKVLLKEMPKLKFFAKYQSEVRQKFLEIGVLHTVVREEFVFRQGDHDDCMYVILHGSVVIIRNSPEYGNEPLVVSTLYDGDSFGELELFAQEGSASEGRHESCQAAELTHLLLIPKAAYHNIMLSQVENHLEHKIHFLVGLPFFAGAQQTHLIPLASNLDPAVFSFNEAIIRKGDTPKGLYVILAGYCNIYSEGFCLRPKHLAQYASARVRTPQPLSFRTGNATFHSPKLRNFDPETQQIPGKALTSSDFEQNKELAAAVHAFFHGKDLKALLRTHYVTQERIFKKALRPRDFFCGRALLEGTYDERTGKLRQVLPSKYSVVAESSSVQLLLVTRAQLPLLGERLMEQLKKHLSRADDCDCPAHLTEKSIESEFRSWARYKEVLLDRTRREQCAGRSENKQNPAAAL